jgi:hypothetical protein
MSQRFDAYEWNDRYERDLERERRTQPRQLTPDDLAERVLFAAGLTCSYDDEDDRRGDEGSEQGESELGGDA